MAPRPSATAPQPPPNLPDLPGMPEALPNYLRTFALWCRNMFQDKLPAHQALPGVMVQAVDAATGAQTPFVYRVGVKVTVTGGVPSAPAVTFTLVPLGSGQP